MAAIVDAWDRVSALLPGPEATLGWRGAGDRHRFVVQAAVPGVGRGSGTRLLREIAVAADRVGWHLAAAERRGACLLRGRCDRPPIELRAEAGLGATVVRLRGAPLHLAGGDLSRVVAEAATWA